MANAGSIKEMLSWLNEQVGTTESPPGSNEQKYGKEFGVDGVPWCAEFVWCGLTAVHAPVTKTASAHLLLMSFEKDGRLTTEFDEIEPGDVLGWNFSSSKSLPNIEHVSVAVAKPAAGSVMHIGGNTSATPGSGSQDNGGMVAKKPYPSSYFVAAARPAYADGSEVRTKGTLPRTSIEKGDRGHDVRLVQHVLKKAVRPALRADGIFGPLTQEATKEWQRSVGRSPTGTLSEDALATLVTALERK